MLLSGVVVFAVLVGFVTDSILSFTHGLAAGRTKVVEKGHTLILGTTESTPRLVTQLALMRRRWLVANEAWDRRVFPWRRVPPSTPLVARPVVVICDTATKREIEQSIAEAFTARGIQRRRTRLGKDIVVRVGDPSSIKDLVRVSAEPRAGTKTVARPSRSIVRCAPREILCLEPFSAA